MRDVILGAGFAAAIAVTANTFVIGTFHIPSESMSSTLEVGDRILVNKLADIQRGSVIVFSDADNWSPGDGDYLVKRVIGLPGDHVRVVDGLLSVNGTTVQEPYLPDGVSASDTNFNVLVPVGHLWVMGDNRTNSADSREHQDGKLRGFVPVESVLGSAFMVFWPADEYRLLDGADEVFNAVPAPDWEPPRIDGE